MQKYSKTILVYFFLMLTACIVLMNDWDNPYKRPISGDAKGYYAYLPAVFIYQDREFKFVDEIEQKYYPKDGSLKKDFLVEQPNGTFVNKCFPGVSLFYLPFFVLAYLLSLLTGFPLDGYSQLFQLSLVVSHLFYYMLSLHLMNKLLNSIQVNLFNRFLTLFLLTFGTHIFFYTTLDFSVVHIFGFFGTTLFLFLLQRWSEQMNWLIIGKLLVLLSLLAIMRPTNILIVLAAPLFVDWKKSIQFLRTNFSFARLPYIYLVITVFIVSIPLVLWKLQTGKWFVYSYGNEKIDLFKPHLWQFLFSVTKGWWFWTPIMLVMFLGAMLYYWKQKAFIGIYFTFFVLVVAYVFSSWWIWTYGGGMGQRPMIDFYPIIAFGFAGFLQGFVVRKFYVLLFLPLIGLNIIQSFQIHKSILVGGQTTWADYVQQFLQIKRPIPEVAIESHWQKVATYRTQAAHKLDNQNHFSEVIEISQFPNSYILVVQVRIKGKHESEKISLVISDSKGDYYQSQYLGNVLYNQERTLSYKFQTPKNLTSKIRLYLWNGDSDEVAHVSFIQVDVYKSKG